MRDFRCLPSLGILSSNNSLLQCRNNQTYRYFSKSVWIESFSIFSMKNTFFFLGFQLLFHLNLKWNARRTQYQFRCIGHLICCTCWLYILIFCLYCYISLWTRPESTSRHLNPHSIFIASLHCNVRLHWHPPQSSRNSLSCFLSEFPRNSCWMKVVRNCWHVKV